MINNITRIAIIYLVFSIQTNGQNFDSLRNVILISDSDSIKMSAAYIISRDICHVAPDSGIYYGKMAYGFADMANIEKGKASAYSQIAFSYNKKEVIDSAILYWNKSANIYEELGDEFHAAYILTNSGTTLAFQGKYEDAERILLDVKNTMEKLDSQRHLVNVINNLGLVFDLKGDYDKGFDYYMQAFSAAEYYKDINGMGTALNNMSVMYYYKGDYQRTIDYGRRALDYWRDDKYLGGRSKAIKNIAISYEFLGKIDSSIIMHRKAIDIDEKMNNDFGLAKSYNNIGCLYADQGKIDLGLDYLNKALSIKSKMGIRESIASTYNYLGSIYTKKKNYKKAKKYLEQGNSIAISSQSPEDLKDNLSFYSEYYEAIGNYLDAFHVNNEYHELKDSLINLDVNKKIEELNIKYETADRIAKNVKLTLENEKSNSIISKQKATIWGGSITLFLLGLLGVYILKQRNELKLANHDLTENKNMIVLLNKELNHRVKNNLAFIMSLMQMQARRSESQETKAILKESENRLLALSKVHTSLKNNESLDISLEQYLKGIISNLISAFQSKEKKIHISSKIDNVSLDAETGMRLGLIINELITNSMKHVNSLVVDIHITVDVSTMNGVTLRYQDNGSGIERHLNSKDSSKSMGLQLIRILKDQLKGKVDIILV